MSMFFSSFAFRLHFSIISLMSRWSLEPVPHFAMYVKNESSTMDVHDESTGSAGAHHSCIFLAMCQADARLGRLKFFNEQGPHLLETEETLRKRVYNFLRLIVTVWVLIPAV